MGDFHQHGLITTLHQLNNRPLEKLEADLIEFGKVDAVGCSSIFHFTNFTPEDCRVDLRCRGIPARNS